MYVMLMKNLKAVFLILLLFGVCPAWASNTLVVADFEVWENNVQGENGSYGSLEPDWDATENPYSWFYDKSIKDTKNFKSKNIHKGKASYRLVHAMGLGKNMEWGNFSIQLGPTLDEAREPVQVKPLDVSEFKYLTFWLKGEKGGETITVSFRDMYAESHLPQYKSKESKATKSWKKIKIPLGSVRKKVDLDKLVSVSITFDKSLKNKPGAILYIDDFVFSTAP